MESRGLEVFLTSSCAMCHNIEGTSATSHVGPDLTHLASRSTLAANTIPNTSSELSDWIRDPQHVKPGNRMPALGLSPDEVEAVVAYLRGLK